MAETAPARLGEGWTGGSYASQWNRFVAWSEGSGNSPLPASPEDVASYLEERWESGAKPSTLIVVATAIARNHREAGFEVPVQRGIARAVLDKLTREEVSGSLTPVRRALMHPPTRAGTHKGSGHTCPPL